jgi:hypothetical protein
MEPSVSKAHRIMMELWGLRVWCGGGCSSIPLQDVTKMSKPFDSQTMKDGHLRDDVPCSQEMPRQELSGPYYDS